MSRTACTKLAKWSFYCTSARGSSPITFCDDCKVAVVRRLCALARCGVCISVVWKGLEEPKAVPSHIGGPAMLWDSPAGTGPRGDPPPRPICGSARALR